jgi:hypothetical protein
MPSALPTTVATAVARPQAIALAIAKRTLGPGAKIISTDAIKYSGNLLGIGIYLLSKKLCENKTEAEDPPLFWS